MQKPQSGQRLYAATDLVNFLECEHLTTLDLGNLDTPLEKAVDDEQAELIKSKGFAHEAAYLQRIAAVERRRMTKRKSAGSKTAGSIIEFEVADSGGTLRASGFKEAETRVEFYDYLVDRWEESPADLADAMARPHCLSTPTREPIVNGAE